MFEQWLLLVFLRHESWRESVTEFARHLVEDWPAILGTFQPPEPPGALTEVSTGLGDSHRGGRSVVLLRFESGFRLVYKPRSLRIDEHFKDLLEWLNARSDLDFRTPRVLSRERHGWVEWVESAACRDRRELERFYRRQGGLIALCYVLEATDFHLENVVAAGEHPVMVDLESIFHQRYERDGDDPFQERAAHSLRHSVLRSGLLPSRIWVNAERQGVDVSGLGGQAGQLVPGVFSWEGAGTDQMHLLRKSVPMLGAKNLPRLGDEVADPVDFVEEVVEGFTSVYELVLRHRSLMLSEGGVLDAFADDENRFIFRSTRLYHRLLQHGRHPDYQRNGLHRDRFFDHLWEGVEPDSGVAEVIMAERRDLERGDVPFFTTRPGSRDLWSSEGKRFPDFFERTSLDTIRSRIESLDAEDLDRQRWLVRACLALLAKSSQRDAAPSWPPDDVEVAASPPREFLETATSIGEKLADLAFYGKDDVTWVGFVQRHDDYCNVEPLGSDFYGGQSGVAFFLAYLGALTDNDRFTDLARRALVPVHRRLREQESAMEGVGAFAGWGGWIYVLTHLSALWGDDDLLAEADEALEEVTKRIPTEEIPDVVAGVAGCLGALVALSPE